MKRTYFQVVSLLLVALIIAPQYADAATEIETTVAMNFAASGDPDDVQNNLDDAEETNAETWDPVTQGVYYGGWSKESVLRLSNVPADNFEVALAQVVWVPSQVIMSGSSFFTVRLPMMNSDSPWNRSLLNIYEIGPGTNWTFIKNETHADVGDTIPHQLNSLRVSFTAGPHQLVYWSRPFDPTDESPTDGNDHYSRSNRTYAQVNAPISPGQFYLFITYVWYDADAYVDVYFEPDSLTMAEWNRSTVAVYNEVAPDTYNLEVSNLEVSLGYSFDFVHGFGESSCGLNKYFYTGDELTYWSYLDPDETDLNGYLSIMVPFRSNETDGVDIDLECWAVDMGDTANNKIVNEIGETWNDFVLYSTTVDLDTLISLTNYTGWFRTRLTIQENVRLRFSLWDLPYTEDTGYNYTWFEETRVGWPFTDARYIHDDDYRWNPLEYLLYDAAGGEDRTYHWALFHSLQVNDYYWAQTLGSTPATSPRVDIKDMSFLEAYFYANGYFWVTVGDFVGQVNPPAGYVLRAFGTGMQLLAMADIFPDFMGWAVDGLLRAWDGLRAIGSWLWKVGAAAIGGLRFLLELGEVIFALLILILAIVVWFVPIFFTVKGAMAIRKAALGRFDEAMDEIKGAVAVATSITKRGRG